MRGALGVAVGSAVSLALNAPGLSAAAGAGTGEELEKPWADATASDYLVPTEGS